MELYDSWHQLTVHLTGGVSNTDPDASLGGVPVDDEYREMPYKIASPIPGIRVLQLFGDNGIGTASLVVDANGDLVFTPPGGTVGATVEIAVGETRIVAGESVVEGQDAGVMVERESSDRPFAGEMTFELRPRFNGVLAMGNLDDTERQAGKTTYRCVVLTNEGESAAFDLDDIVLDIEGDTQATYFMGTEELDSIGDVQEIPDEETAPDGIDFDQVTGGSSNFLEIVTIEAGDGLGIWIKKVFPAGGTVSAQDDVVLNMSVEASAGYDRTIPEAYRVADDNFERYELYIGEDELPGFGDSDPPVETSLTLPFSYTLTPPASGTTLFYVVVKKRNEYNLLSFNQWTTIIEIDSSGDEVYGPLTAPETLMTPSQAMMVTVLAFYCNAQDRNPADSWKVWIKEGSAPDPDVDPADYEGDFVNPVGDSYRLQQTFGPFTSESTVYAYVAVVRESDGEEELSPEDSTEMPTVYDVSEDDASAFGG